MRYVEYNIIFFYLIRYVHYKLISDLDLIRISEVNFDTRTVKFDDKFFMHFPTSDIDNQC